MERLSGLVVTQQGAAPGTVSFDSLIRSVDGEPGADDAGRIILPGFVDAHVHGGGGADTMDGADGVRTLARFHLEHGTTTIVPTTMTNPWERIMDALLGVARVRSEADPDLPDIPGAHMEGPFISRNRLGAQPDHVLVPDPQLVDQALASGVLKVVTLAPEVRGTTAAARAFARAGACVSLGHSTADPDEAAEVLHAVSLAGGTAGFTHLYNAMGGLAARQPGLVGSALTSPGVFAEVIADLQHVHPVAIRLAHAVLGTQLMFVTDAMRATGTSEGESELGGQAVFVSGGRASLADGTLAGSILTMDQAVRNARSMGFTWPQVASAVSGAPARYLGLGDRGALAPGLRSDLVVLNSDLSVAEVWLGGRRVHATA